MFRIKRKFKGVLCKEKACARFDDLLSLIPQNRIQADEAELDGYNDFVNSISEDPEEITKYQIDQNFKKIHHLYFLSKQRYFLPDSFNNEQMDKIYNNNYYKYNVYIMEMPKEFSGIFIAAPYWEIISEIDQIIAGKLKGRMLYYYASTEEIIKKIKNLDLNGRLKLAGGAFHINGASSKIRNVRLRGANLLETKEFSFIFDNPNKYTSTEVRLRYSRGLFIRQSIVCDTKGRFFFSHPNENANLLYIFIIINYLIENDLLKETVKKPFDIVIEGN